MDAQISKRTGSMISSFKKVINKKQTREGLFFIYNVCLYLYEKKKIMEEN